LDFPDAIKLSDNPRMTCIATWFFMREDELEKANIQDVITSVGKLGLLFPIRKADQECGFRAFRDCICKGRPSRSWWCPPCALRSQQLERRQELSALGFLGEDLGKQPLFAGRKSSRITKEEVVRGIETIATRQGVPLVKSNGRRRFGGHTYRITGAVFSFMTGATDQEVADLGGWRSIEIMKKYLRGVPFSRTSSVSTRLADAVDSGARTSCREEALADEAVPAGGGYLPSITLPSHWRNLASGLLHKGGKLGHLGCGALATTAFARFQPKQHGLGALAFERLCGRPGCWYHRPAAIERRRPPARKVRRMVGLA
jgi:hypothetical protein